MFLGSRGLPREIPQAHEGSQEAPKELQDLKKRVPNLNPKNIILLINSDPILGAILGPEWASKLIQNWFFFGARFWTSFC